MTNEPGRGAGAPGGKDSALTTQLYRELFQLAPIEVHIWQVLRDASGEICNWRLVDANPAALASWGMRHADSVGRTADTLFPETDAVATFLPVVEQIMATGEALSWETDFEGTGQILRMVSFPIRDHFVSTGFDVTDLRHNEKALSEALLNLQQAIRAGGVGLWDWDLQTNQVHFSPEWKRQLGHEPEGIGDRFEEWSDRLHPDDREATLAGVAACVEQARPSHEAVFRLRHRDGSWRWILAQSSLVLDDGGRPLRMLGSHLDITERKLLEERVLATQKLESVGTLAAGIAHDFNNLLSAVVGNLSLLGDVITTDPETRELLDEIENATERARALTFQLLTFSRGGAPVREVASTRELIEHAASFVTRGSRSRCAFSFAPDLANVEADPGQIAQVVENLVINADQAMSEGGTIRIDAATVDLEPANAFGLAPGPYVRLAIADDGPGIEAADRARIFDPFFTTKAEGSGLGLSSSQAIARHHGGVLSVASRSGEGAVFTLHLPASSRSVEARPATEVLRGTGRILVMDDDAAIRSLMERMLDRLGYTCETVADGDEACRALELAIADGQRQDLLILDLTIPGSDSGTDVLARLRALAPDVPAIVTSGYSEDDALAHPGAHGFQGRLRKPLNLATLGAELDRVLEARRRDAADAS